MTRNTMSLNWRQLAVYIVVVVMEGCWLYAMLSIINNTTVDGSISVIGVITVFPVSVLFHKLLRNLRWHKVPLSIISWLAWLAGMLLLVKFQLFAATGWFQVDWLQAVPRAIGQVLHTFSPELLILLASAVVWWLGGWLADKGVKFGSVVTRFQFGLIMLLLALYISYATDVPVGHSIPVALLFFLCALLGISLAHTGENTGWFSSRLYRGRWSVLLLCTIALILLLGLLIGLIISADLLHMIVAAVKWVWAWIMQAIMFIISLFPTPEGGEIPPAEIVPPQMDTSGQMELLRIPEPVKAVLRIIWFVLFAGIVVIALWRVSAQIVQWMRRRLSGMVGDESEPLRGAFREDLMSLFRLIANRIKSLLRTIAIRGQGATAPENITIRQMYCQFLRWSGSRGYPRHRAYTPYDFLAVMRDAMPGYQPELLLLTQRYVRARYGGSIPTGEEMKELANNWHTIKKYKLKRPKEEHVDLKGENENGQNG